MNINRNENIPLGIPTLPPTVAEALIALESLDDCARMSEGIDAYGPRGVLERFIAYYANLPFHGMPLAARPARQAGVAWQQVAESLDQCANAPGQHPQAAHAYTVAADAVRKNIRLTTEPGRVDEAMARLIETSGALQACWINGATEPTDEQINAHYEALLACGARP
jgi:hypothetical protein